MRIAILAAMDKELQLISSILDNTEERTIDNITMNYGMIAGKEVYIAKCGIGKVNSALSAYRVIKAVSPDLVINSGVAGGAGLPVGSLLVADRVAYSDVWCGPGTKYGEADGFPLFLHPSPAVIDLAKNVLSLENPCFGLICSGDKFISSAEEIAFIRSHFPDVCAVDMESASISQTCMLTGVPFSIIRIVSDTPGEGENVSQYKNFWTDAPVKTFSAVRAIIENI